MPDGLQIPIRTLGMKSITNATRYGFASLGMKIINFFIMISSFTWLLLFVTVIPAISNENTLLALTRSIEFTCPCVSGSTSGKTLVGCTPLGFPPVDPSTLGRKSLYLLFHHIDNV